MANKSTGSFNLGSQQYANGLYAVDSGTARDPSVDGAAIDYTAFAAALATLVADGASPTEAHVTAVNNAWTTLKGQIDAAVASVATLDDDAIVILNTATITSFNKAQTIRDAINGYLRSHLPMA